MTRRIITAAIILNLIFSCTEQPSKETNKITATNDTIANTTTLKDSGYKKINGMKMYYEVHGSGKPIVLLHGSFVNIPINWPEAIPALAKTRKVIVAEMQAHGRTKDIPRELSYEAMADDVSELLKQLKIDSADILGYSMGAGIAFQFGVRHPEQLRRLLILSGTYTHDGWWKDVENSFQTMNADMFKGSPIQTIYDSLGNDPAKFDVFINKVISIDRKPYNWSKEVKNIKAPMFIAIGDADGVRYEHALELYRAKGGGKMGNITGLPQSRLAILPGTTHIGMMMQWKLLTPMINDFLDSDLNTAPPQF